MPVRKDTDMILRHDPRNSLAVMVYQMDDSGRRKESAMYDNESYTHYAEVDPIHGERLYFDVIPLINEIDAGSPMPQCGNGCSSDFILTPKRTHVQCQECGTTYRVHLTRNEFR